MTNKDRVFYSFIGVQVVISMTLVLSNVPHAPEIANVILFGGMGILIAGKFNKRINNWYNKEIGATNVDKKKEDSE